MSNISKVSFNGNDLDVKDAYAREQILHKTADNYVADVAGDYTVNAGDITMSSANTTMHTTADRTIDTDGNDSVHIDGASTLNVGGLRTETFAGDKTETVTGTATERAGNRNTTVTGKWSVNLPGKAFDMKDVALTADVTSAVSAEATTRADADAALSARIDNAKQYTHFVVIGDSYSTNTQTGGPLWYTYLEKRYGLTAYLNAVDGVGYSTGGDNDFIHQLQKAADALDVTRVKTVYIFGGLNDIGNTAVNAQLFGGYVERTMQEAIRLFPSSEIVVAGIQPFQSYNFYSGSSVLEFGRARQFSNFLNFYCSKYGVKFINLEYMGLFTPEFFGEANNGNQKHPSSIGSAVIASSIMSGHSVAQGTDRAMPELIPTIDNGTISIKGANATGPNQVTVTLNVVPTSETFSINWNGFPYAPDLFTMSIVGGTSIVGYYTTNGVITFNNATPNITYYGNYTINV